MQYHWDNARNKPTAESIKELRLRIRTLKLQEEQEIIYDSDGENFRHKLAQELDNQKNGHKVIALDHLVQLLKSDIKLADVDLHLHPFFHFKLEGLQWIYHFWIKQKEKHAWRQHIEKASDYSLHHTIKQRIDELPTRIRYRFQKVYGYREGAPTYEENFIGMLEFVKNVIHHCNDGCPRDDWKLNFEELEEAIILTFPELFLLIANYCLENNIRFKELIEDKEVEGKSETCDGCLYCEMNDPELFK